MYGEVFLHLLYGQTHLNHIAWAEHLIETPHQNLEFKDPTDKVRHEGFIFSLASNLQHRKKVFSYFDFSTTLKHGAYAIFELMTEFMLV